MKKRTLLIAALMGGCALQSMAQQILPDDVAGDKEYRRVCREYELKSKNSVELLQAYLDKYHCLMQNAMIVPCVLPLLI